jgi:hypothetical protein
MGAKMSAMDNATRNAAPRMIGKLTLFAYNRQRQAADHQGTHRANHFGRGSARRRFFAVGITSFGAGLRQGQEAH